MLLMEKGKQPVDIEVVREVDRRLKFCHNPEKDPESSLYKKREREKEENEERKRDNKTELRKNTQDPFA